MKKLIALLVLMLALTAHAADKVTGETPKGPYELIEWVVLIVDPNRTLANEAAAFKSTLPGFARGRRAVNESADSVKRPSPVGVIRLTAPNGADEEPIDVLLQTVGGRFLGSWPEGKARNNRLLWDNVLLHEGPARPVLVDGGHWFTTLRSDTDSATLSSASRWSERFLMYDAEIPYRNIVRIEATTDGYRLANAGLTPLRDVDIYAPTEKGWRVGSLADLQATAQPVSTTKPAEPATKQAADAAKDVFADAKPQTKPVRSSPSLMRGPSTKPAPVEEVAASAWRNVKLGDASSDALGGWRSRLKEAGLKPADVETISAMLQAHALDTEQLTVVYRIDSSELDRLLPLEVVPAPVKTTRVGLVIVKNIDPAAGDRIVKLIQQLGDPNWEKREAAHAKLTEIGAGARPKLTEALKNPDIEIAYRVERLLAALSSP
jgi:hypothetical protein